MAALVAYLFHKWADPKGSTEQCKDSEGATGKTEGKLLHGKLRLHGVSFRKEGL